MATKAVLAKAKPVKRPKASSGDDGDNGTADPGTRRNWYVVLQLDDEGRVQPQPDWRTNMKIGDRVKFLSPDGVVEVVFTPQDAKDKAGRPVVGLNPFGKGTKPIKGGRELHTIKNSCKSIMACMIIDHKGVKHDYKGVVTSDRKPEVPKPGDIEGGAGVCTGGTGTSQVNCHP